MSPTAGLEQGGLYFMETIANSALEIGLLDAQSKAKQLLCAIEEKNLIVVGASENEITEKIYQLAYELFGSKKHWHKRIVRTGENTVFAYSANPPNLTLQDGDLVYLDLGPIFDEFEGDIGKTYLLGKDPNKERLTVDLERIFVEAKKFYLLQPSMTGAELWLKVTELTEEAGWKFGNYHAGHIIGEFSHKQMYGDLPEHRISPLNNVPMNTLAVDGKRHHWILEIHLVHSQNLYGGFFEDLLTVE